jgi:hypothetical protein
LARSGRIRSAEQSIQAAADQDAFVNRTAGSFLQVCRAHVRAARLDWPTQAAGGSAESASSLALDVRLARGLLDRYSGMPRRKGADNMALGQLGR